MTSKILYKVSTFLIPIDQIVIYPIAQNGVMQSTNVYPFPRTFFTAAPNIITCKHFVSIALDTYQISSFTEINYFLTLRVNRASVNFTFNSQNMEWAFLRVKFWLTARSDLLVGSFVLCSFYSIFRKYPFRHLKNSLNCHSH